MIVTNAQGRQASPSGIAELCLNIKQLAAVLGVSSRHIERLDSSGQLPKPLRLGRAKRWRTSEIGAWLEAGCPDRQAWRAMRGGAA